MKEILMAFVLMIQSRMLVNIWENQIFFKLERINPKWNKEAFLSDGTMGESPIISKFQNEHVQFLLPSGNECNFKEL